MAFRAVFATVFVLLGMAIYGAFARAQSGAGSIQGTVTDPTGAVMQGASIHVVNQATGVASDTKSNDVGFYQVPNLFTGTYVVSITAPGMKTNAQTIELLAGQNAVINSSLSPGAVNQQVTVNANAIQLVTTDNGSLTSTLENARINQLPMNTRDITNLVRETTPGVETCIDSNACFNGQQAPATEFVADGVSYADRDFGGNHFGAGVADLIDPDSVQEVRVEDLDSGAQFAAPSTPVMTTKSGTNQLHGTAFWTGRNNSVGIARGRSNPSNFAAPQLIRNEFGASAGGPIVIPHMYHGKDKSFWFFAYERYSLAQNVLTSSSVPTQAMTSGDFSGLTSSAGILQELYDPNTTANSASCLEPASAGTATFANKWCRQPFGGNAATGSSYNYIPSGRESPTTKILNQMTPHPTNSNNPLIAANEIRAVPEPVISPQITFRLDHVFNENNRAYLRYSQNLAKGLLPASSSFGGYSLPAGSIPAGASNEDAYTYRTFATALGFTHVFSPTFFSETILSMQQLGQKTADPISTNTNYESPLGTPNSFGEVGFPYFTGLFQPLLGSQYGYGMSQKLDQVDENLTKTIGKHQLLFGGRYRFEQFGLLVDENEDQIQFGGDGTALENPSSSNASPAPYSNSGNANADEFIGSAYNYTVNLQHHYGFFHDMEFDGYLQDNYHIRRNLTLNLGLRYEAHPAISVGQGALITFDLKNHALVTPLPISQLIANGVTTQAVISNDQINGATFETPGLAGLPSSLIRNNDFTWGPRFGIAWQPFGKWGTVLRGGLGRYIFPTPIREDYPNFYKNNPFLATYQECFTCSSYAPDSLPNYQLRSMQSSDPSYTYATQLAGGGTPIMGVNTGSNLINTTTTTALPPGLTLSGPSPDLAPSYTEEANFTIEQPLKWNSAFRVSYVYTHGTNLHNRWLFNDHPSTFNWELQQGTTIPNSGAYGPTNSVTGEGPYDQLIYSGNVFEWTNTGWSNYNAVQANYQKLYHNGVAWQIMYVWSKSMRTGSLAAGVGEDYVDPYSAYGMSYVGNYVNAGANTVTYAPEGGTLIAPQLPPPPPTGTPAWGYYKALNRWENYMVDFRNPPQHLQFNWIVDLPFGRGKRLLSNANKALNEVVGGWQLAGDGSVTQTLFGITNSMWGPTASSTGPSGNSLHVYKKGMPITDCRSGICKKGYEWWNGYVPPTAASGNTCAAGLSTVVSGLSSNWVPYQTPIDTICSAPVNGKPVTDKYFGTSDVIMNGVTGQTANSVIAYGDVPANNVNGVYSSGVSAVTNPFGHTLLPGPFNWTADVSLFKVLPITEHTYLRMNLDAFNVFNMQGTPNPSGSDGTVCVTPGGVGCSSNNTPRQLQLTLRLTF